MRHSPRSRQLQRVARRGGSASVVCACHALEPRRLLAAAPVGVARDTAFGNGGTVVTDLLEGPQSSTDIAFDAATLTDGDFVIVGAGGNGAYDFGAVARYNPDGSLDTAFGRGGISLYDGGAQAGRLNWHAALPAPGNKLIAAGGFSRGLADPAYDGVRPMLARFNPDGTLDTTFGTDGTGTVRPAVDVNGDIWSLAPLPDGRVLAGGVVYGTNGSDPRTTLWRFNADGTPDTTFGTGGLVTHTFDPGASIRSLAVMPDGNFFAADGFSAVLLFNPDGSLRAEYGGYNPVLARQGDDKVVVATNGDDQNLHVARRLADGSPDPSFTEAVVDLGGSEIPLAVLGRPDGSVLVAARTRLAGDFLESAHLLRLRPDGTFDADFTPGGALFLFNQVYDQGLLRRLLPAANGRVIAAGGAASYDFVAARLAIDPPRLVVDAHQEGQALEGGTALLWAQESSYAGGTIRRYEWDADYDGRDFTADAEGVTAQVPVGDDNPARTVALRVTTSDGLQAVSPIPVQIQNVPPSIGSVVVPSTATYGWGTTVTGIVGDPGRDAITVSVDFGDGSPPEVVRPNAAGVFTAGHVYAARGTYTVKLKATDDDGGSTSAPDATVRVVDLAGTVFRDQDGDGTRDPGEPPLAGFTVFLDANDNGQPDAGEPQAVTGDSGAYFFDGVEKGTYLVRVVTPAGWRVTNAPASLGAVSVTDTHGARRDFGLTEKASITGIVFLDANRNGAADPGEGTTNLSTGVYLDLDNDGFFDAGAEPLAVSNPRNARNFLFENLDPGTYTVRQFGTSFAAAQYAQTSPGPAGAQTGITVTVGRAEESGGHVFGAYRTNLAVTGIVYDDRNRNGVQNAPNEPVLTGRVVYFDADNDARLDPDEVRSTTSLGGTYQLRVIEGVSYKVRVAVPDGWVQSQPSGGNPYSVTPDPANPAALANRNFGIHTALQSAVVGRYVFYGGSVLAGRDAADPANDSAIAPDKTALLPGAGAARFANVTSYADGITGITVDLMNLAQKTFPENGYGQLFSLRAASPGGAGVPQNWEPLSAAPAMAVRRGQGVGGSDRVVLLFDPRTSVKNGWLQVTVLANADTGLARPDVFSFGNLPGETGDAASPLRVSALDLAAAKRALGATAAIDSAIDFDRDGRVSALDVAVVRQSLGRSLAAIPAQQPVAVTGLPAAAGALLADRDGQALP